MKKKMVKTALYESQSHHMESSDATPVLWGVLTAQLTLTSGMVF